MADELAATARALARVASDPGALEIADHLAKVWQDEAARRAPVDTGQLRARTQVESVSGARTRGTATIVSDVPYAGFQEYGTRFQPPQPYFRAGRDEAGREADRLGVGIETQLRRVLDSGGVWNPRSLL